MSEGYATGWRWPSEEGERVPGEPDDMTRPITPVRTPKEQDPTGLGDINWPKAFVIVAVTLILVVGLVTVVALVALPGEFWLTP